MTKKTVRTSATRMVGAAIAVLALAAVTACSSGMETASPDSGAAAGPKDGPLTIAFLQKQGDQQYFIDEANGAKEAAQAAGDVTINAVDLGTDSNKAISEVEAAIAQQVDGIIIVVPDQQIGPQVIQLAKDAGIPIMAADDTIEDAAGNAAPFSGFDGTSMGEKVGAEAARLYEEAGWTAANTRILSAYKQDLTVCQQRVDGAKSAFTEAISDGPEVIDVGTDNSATDAQDKAGAVITANAGVTNWVVWGCNDESETGVVTALQNSGVAADNIIGVGLGAYLTCKDWKAGQQTGNKAALFISGVEVGKAAANSMIDLLRNGTALPPQSIANTEIVDASNWEAKGVVCT
ncbi:MULTISPECIES: substrate-binding domain-containing protein [Microbacterium]|uniref:Substrate-binding domain-containing protein n=1 Tax=Microbacterium algihabitans TaxID=3075992 RepID=A0ABU3RWE0_9MICO|nr:MULTISPECIES: substrate-binding domain-containing protein [Microbacterium]MCD2170613.1 substrate-binding domain-containing protein [Microbacterium sp. JC 701]MDU0327186.1 substrate-binding domain-containing protein [Microbacterium sp. KSW2-21]